MRRVIMAGTPCLTTRCLLLMVPALLACTTPEPGARAETAAASSPDVDAAFRAHLGRTWELTRLGEQYIPASATGAASRSQGRHPGPGARPTIRFTDESPSESSVHPPGTRSAGGWSFCNGYGTAYELGPGGALRFHGFQSTLVGCDGPDSLESRFFRGLSETRRVQLDSAGLVLIAANGGRLTFVLASDTAAPPVR